MDTKYHLLALAIFFFISIFFLSPSDGRKVSPLPVLVVVPAPAPASVVPAPAPAPVNLINEICDRKDTGVNKEFCMEILKSDPRTANPNASLITLFNVTMELAISNITKTRDYFNNLSLSKPDDKLNQTYVFCLSRYDTVIKIFRDTITQVANKDKSDMETVFYDLAVTSDYAGECRERLFFHGVRDGPIEKMTRDVVEYTEVCDEIAIALSEKSPS